MMQCIIKKLSRFLHLATLLFFMFNLQVSNANAIHQEYDHISQQSAIMSKADTKSPKTPFKADPHHDQSCVSSHCHGSSYISSPKGPELAVVAQVSGLQGYTNNFPSSDLIFFLLKPPCA